ncbi:hypothetical protein R84B8_03073 [Treponema sp. R8-4-B8]
MKKALKLFVAIRSIAIIALVAVIGFGIIGCDNGGGDDKGGSDNNTSNTNPDVGTGNQTSRKYRVEVYNINSATYTYLSNNYSGKSYQDVARASVISRGHTAANTYTNQSFSDVISKFTNVADSIGLDSTNKTKGNNALIEALQTNNRNGYFIWFGTSLGERFFYVNRTGTGPNYYTVEVYNINSATYTYLSNNYSGKSYQDVARASVISRGHTAANTYTNQSFPDVISKFTNVADSIGLDSTNKTKGNDALIEALQTNNRNGYFLWFSTSSGERFFYVTQE